MDIQPPKIPIDQWINQGIDWLTSSIGGVTNVVANWIDGAVGTMTDFLTWYPAPLMIVLFALLAWWISRRVKIGFFTLVALGFIWGGMGLWVSTIQTLNLVLLSAVLAIAIGIPLGIMGALFKHFRVVLMPVLDVMQTLPPFVYLLPAVPIFGLGSTAAVFATVIFAMPPVTRLTTLGIQQVPDELVEAVDAFGSTRWQKLVKLQFPLAMASIRAGVNQTILLSLSMVVIAAMIGARGLGAEVWKAIQRLQYGRGFEAGIAIVLIAMVLDRVMRRVGQTTGSSESAATAT